MLAPLAVNILEGLTKTRHPTAKAAAQAPAKQGATKKRSCNADKPMCMRTSEGEDASLHKEASILASLRKGPAKKQRPPEGPRALPLRPISTYKQCSEAARAQSPARRMQGCASMLEGLAKARHPAARAAAEAATEAPAKQGVAKKRSCSAGKPMCAR